MAIRLVESPEPLTGASSQQTALLIESEGLRMLRQELRRYCDQKVSGRSFLVAGHRGSGKTTMVQGSIQRTEDEIESDWDRLNLASRQIRPAFEPEVKGTTILRPLFILLQGPNLLPADPTESPASAAKTATPAAGSSTAASADPPPPATHPPTNPMETVLLQITLGLYRGLAGEFTRAYTEKAVANARTTSKFGSERAKRLSRRQLELALQFEL